jgi:hypothetical protein
MHMQVCNWNWGAIAGFTGAAATLVAGIIALYISSKWREEKNSEILSNEAAKILVILEDYRENLVNLDHEMMQPSRSNNKNKLEELRQIARQLHNRATLFGELANHENIATEIKAVATASYGKANRLNEKSFQEIRNNSKSPILVSEFDVAIEKPKAILIIYLKHQR